MPAPPPQVFVAEIFGFDAGDVALLLALPVGLLLVSGARRLFSGLGSVGRAWQTAFPSARNSARERRSAVDGDESDGALQLKFFWWFGGLTAVAAVGNHLPSAFAEARLVWQELVWPILGFAFSTRLYEAFDFSPLGRVVVNVTAVFLVAALGAWVDVLRHEFRRGVGWRFGLLLVAGIVLTVHVTSGSWYYPLQEFLKSR